MLRELAEAVATRRVGARELVALALERIERLDPGIGAVVAVRGDQALEEAAALDERLAQGEPAGPLAGIPFLVKDIEDLRAAPTTHGSLLFRQAARARADGVIPARLRAAGAIPVGKANTPEFASEGFTANRLFGATRNPWAPEWSPGGSSGGSAAAMATGMVPVATATDTGGSIRIPAAFCGLAGIKPTKGLVPFDDDLYWGDLTTAGPLGATVDDLRLLLDVMADRTLEDASLPRRVIAVPRFVPAGPLPKGVEVAFATALGAIERDLGFPVEPLEPEALGVPANPEADWGRWTAPELVAWLGRDRAERSLDLMYPTVRAFMEAGLRVPTPEYVAVRSRGPAYERALAEAMGEDAVIASPTLTLEGWTPEGPVPGLPGSSPPSEAFNTAVQNLAGIPAISVPAGRLPNGLPFGLQFTGPRFGDAMLLGLAAAWERARPWAPAAPGYASFAP